MTPVDVLNIVTDYVIELVLNVVITPRSRMVGDLLLGVSVAVVPASR